MIWAPQSWHAVEAVRHCCSGSNTLATKAIDEYMKLVAQDYLQETLGEQSWAGSEA